MCVLARAGMLAPMLVQMERQIDREIAADNRAAGVSCDTQTDANGGDGATEKGGAVDASVGTEAQELFDSDTEDEEEEEPVLMYGPQPQIVTNDLKSLDEMVSVFCVSRTLHTKYCIKLNTYSARSRSCNAHTQTLQHKYAHAYSSLLYNVPRTLVRMFPCTTHADA